MPYKLAMSENEVLGKGKFANAKGNTECVVFVQQAAGAPPTSMWSRGLRVKDAKDAEIPKGTAIATFDDNGKYPTDGAGKHAAIYLSHSSTAIRVLDQWKSQGEVKERSIWFDKPAGTSRSNDANTFWVIE
jgi:hypothetical protein